MMLKIRAFLATAALVAFAVPALGQSLVAQVGPDDRLGLHVAIPVTEFLSIQAGYSEMSTEIPNREVTAQALGADALFSLPASDRLDVLLSAGLHAMDDTRSSGAEGRISVGLSYELSKSWAMRGEVESFNGTRALFSLSAAF